MVVVRTIRYPEYWIIRVGIIVHRITPIPTQQQQQQTWPRIIVVLRRRPLSPTLVLAVVADRMNWSWVARSKNGPGPGFWPVWLIWPCPRRSLPPVATYYRRPPGGIYPTWRSYWTPHRPRHMSISEITIVVRHCMWRRRRDTWRRSDIWSKNVARKSIAVIDGVVVHWMMRIVIDIWMWYSTYENGVRQPDLGIVLPISLKRQPTGIWMKCKCCWISPKSRNRKISSIYHRRHNVPQLKRNCS